MARDHRTSTADWRRQPSGRGHNRCAGSRPSRRPEPLQLPCQIPARARPADGIGVRRGHPLDVDILPQPEGKPRDQEAKTHQAPPRSAPTPGRSAPPRDRPEDRRPAGELPRRARVVATRSGGGSACCMGSIVAMAGYEVAGLTYASTIRACPGPTLSRPHPYCYRRSPSRKNWKNGVNKLGGPVV